MDKPNEISLSDLLPLHFEGGFKLEALADDCAHCGWVISAPRWRAEISWITPASCVITLSTSCLGCGVDQTRRVRIRAQEQGWASIDWMVGDKWETTVIGNVTWTERVLRAFGLSKPPTPTSERTPLDQGTLQAIGLLALFVFICAFVMTIL